MHLGPSGRIVVGLVSLVLGLPGCGRLGFDPLGSASGDVARRPRIAAGDEFTCVVRDDGTVWCWGDGDDAELGNGSEPARATPMPIAGLADIVAIDAGAYHACALDTVGDVWCWGYNGYGELDGTPSGEESARRVALPRPAIAVSAGGYHSCAVLDDQQLACWGKNNNGQIGVGTMEDMGRPITLVLDRVTDVALGHYHTCAIRDGRVVCWGANAYGQVGDSTTTNVLSPTAAPGLTAATLSAGANHTCAVETASGQVRCWGLNSNGQLGVAASQQAPGEAVMLSGVVALRAGYDHTCALREDATAWCWGRDAEGQRGDGPVAGTGLAPTQVAIDGSVRDLAAGTDHSCALREDGRVGCWGVGRFGQLGEPSLMARATPQLVDLPGTATRVSAGYRHACAQVGGALYCWGDNGSGQVGVATPGVVATPQPTGVMGIADVGLGAKHSCAVDSGGSLRCWGGNGAGQLGDGTTTSRSTPTVVASLGGVSTVSAGPFYTCATTTLSTQWCWGTNAYGQLGDGTTTDSSMPTNVSFDGTLIEAGGSHACSILGNQTRCWGRNDVGQVGNDRVQLTELSPQPVATGSVFTTVSAGDTHTCALDGSGNLSCWGKSTAGALGLDDMTQSLVPVPVAANVTCLSAGYQHTCACANLGDQLVCWGSNSMGQLGDGTLVGHAMPMPVTGFPGPVQWLEAGGDFTCAIGNDDRVRCWGDNTYGQLGIGIVGFSPTPLDVALP